MAELSKETKFFMFLVECYAARKGRLVSDVLREWDAHNITQEIYDNYEMYHIERIENAFADIDSLLACGKHAW